MTKERVKDSRRNIILLFVNELCNVYRNDKKDAQERGMPARRIGGAREGAKNLFD